MRLSAVAPILACLASVTATERTRIPPQQRIDSAGLLNPAAVQAFYDRRESRPAWTGAACPARIAALVSAIDESTAHGLDADAYHRAALTQSGGCEDGIERLATDAWLSLAAHLHAGRVDPVKLEPDWSAARPDRDLIARLEQALASGAIRDSLLGLAPDEPDYQALRAELARHREYGARGGWTGVDDGPKLRLGDRGTRVQQLRVRLARSELLDRDLAESDPAFDENLEAAVKAFQLRANLEPDGIVGPMTLHQLNIDVNDRIRQLRVNLERWRWLPEELGERHLRTNIADFRLEAHSGGVVERQHRVIVGTLYRRTPVFSGRISYVVLNPWWETPRKLAVLDKLPLFGADPSAIEQLGFEIVDSEGRNVDPARIDWATVTAASFPYRLRQRPGPMNALGHVKLMFPNVHGVYLHDTPTRGLFAKVRRDFSSGCIRVEDALDLTAWLLAGTPGWDRAGIDAVVASGAETRVSLQSAVPVHILYLTAVPDENDQVRFLDDLYDRDAAVIAALDAAPHRQSVDSVE